jgi:hypothetical protein
MQAHQILICTETSTMSMYENLTERLLKLNFKHFNIDDETLFVKKVGK